LLGNELNNAAAGMFNIIFKKRTFPGSLQAASIRNFWQNQINKMNSKIRHNHPKINFFAFKMSSHATHSGYNKITEYIDSRIIGWPQEWTFWKKAFVKCFKSILPASGMKWYHRGSLYSEIMAAAYWIKGTNQVFHFIYGENSYRYTGNLKSVFPGNKIICTYHTPPEKLCMLIENFDHLKTIDAVVVVSSSQKSFFEKIIGPERIFFIPHGIDVDYFKPATCKIKPDSYFNCLFVGRHMRDFQTLSDVAKYLADSAPDIRLQVVIPDEFKTNFSGMPNVSVHTGIPIEKLLELYQQSDLLVLPLLESTANNSILEAMACGLPIISTDLPGVKDYVNESCAILTPPKDYKAVVDAIMQLKVNEQLRKQMSCQCLVNVSQFSWQKIAERLVQLYNKIYDIN
jgi:glycosyltransferase involved in cell wall biosynthesis